MDSISKEDSYAERRQLFKNIWDTAMQIDEKDGDIMAKPKVIKTLRLDEVDRCVIGKKKKERIKNLRAVCNKILDFCDRQDADDMFYEQIAEGEGLPHHKLDFKLKKIQKPHRGRKKVKKAKSLFVPKNIVGEQPKATTSERKDDYTRFFMKTSRNTSPIKMKRTTVVRRTLVRRRTSKVKPNPNTEGNNAPSKGNASRRKVVKRKRSKRKKPTAPNVPPPRPSGIFDWPDL